MAKLNVDIQGTPNPNAAKFLLDKPAIGEPSRSYFDAESARGDRLAERLFEIDGVRALFMVEDFITVTKEEDAIWPDIVGHIEAVILSELG
jgi:hypothetical protein